MAGNKNSSALPLTPVLEERYSGIPVRLLDKATVAKENLFSNQTVKISPRRQHEELPVIPKGYPREKFNRAILALQSAIGHDNVILNVDPLDDGWYMEHPNTHDAFYLTQQEDLISCATVFPGSVEEVQIVVRWANEYLMPIYPISMGRNLGYGGAAPRVRGSVVVDLGKRMQRILDINPDTSSCLVEPGVSFYALYEEIQRRGHKDLWIDVPDLGGGSVLGNTIDRGQGYTPAGDHFSSHCGMEVVTPTGDVLRTGMGGLPGNNTWQVFPYGFGPYPDGIFSQSNFGIVTKIGMHLMPDPGGFQGFMCTFKEEEDLFNAIDVIRPLRVRNILENVAQLKHVIQEVALLGKPRSYYWDRPTPMPIEEVRKVAAKLPCGDCTWIYYGTIYGPPQLRKAKEEIIKREFLSIPGARWIERDSLPKDHYFFSRENIASGKPEMVELTWLNWSPNGAHVFFSPVCPPSGKDARKIYEITKRRHKQFNLDNFPTCCIGKREILLIVNMVYDRGDPVSRANAYACMRAMVDDAAKEGYGEYRTHLLLADQVAGTYSWNNHAQMRFNEQLKDSLDPNGILAPGRSGIWPRRYRGKGWNLNNLKPSSEGNEVVYEGRTNRTGFRL